MRRTVQFWQITNGQGQALSSTFPASTLVERLQAARMDRVSRYYTTTDDYRMLAEGVATAPRPHVVLYRSRHVNLPGKDVSGDIVDLGLNDGEGLAEGTHFVFFPRNIVGMLYNNEGPRIRRLAAYLYRKFAADITFVPVYRRDIEQLIASLDRVSKLELSVPANQVHLLSSDDEGFAAALSQSASLLGEGNIRLEVSIGQGAPAERSDHLKSLVRRVARRTDLERFRVVKAYGRFEGDTDTFPIDLKEDQLVTKKDVDAEQPTSTRISVESAAAAIREAYTEFREHIRTVTLGMPSISSTLPLGQIDPAVSHSTDD